jgi:type IV secretory pathway TraG/TraD family ATPase VirD4
MLGFFTHPDIAEIFCSDEPNTIDITDVDKGRIFCTALPQTFQTERRYINTYIKLLFYTHAMMRFDKPKSERKGENLLIALMDEFQALATASEDGISDHNVIDRLRAANCCLILGMQSDASLFPVLGKETAQVLTLNCRSRIAFRQPDPEGAQAVAEFIAKIEKKKKSPSLPASWEQGQQHHREQRVGLRSAARRADEDARRHRLDRPPVEEERSKCASPPWMVRGRSRIGGSEAATKKVHAASSSYRPPDSNSQFSASR